MNVQTRSPPIIAITEKLPENRVEHDAVNPICQAFSRDICFRCPYGNYFCGYPIGDQVPLGTHDNTYGFSMYCLNFAGEFSGRSDNGRVLFPYHLDNMRVPLKKFDCCPTDGVWRGNRFQEGNQYGKSALPPLSHR